MRLFVPLKTAALCAAVCLSLSAKNPPTKDAQVEAKGLAPRTAPSDYLSQTKIGTMTLAAEFNGHSVPTAVRPFTSENYVSVEIALFGPPDARAQISVADFSLRVNGKKAPLSAEQCTVVFTSLKDPEWEPPDKEEKKSKGGISSGGSGGQGDPPPTPAKMPIELVRAMQQQVLKAVLPEGDRPLPQAGLLFFEFRGKTEKIKSLELVYSGPAGNATLNLQP